MRYNKEREGREDQEEIVDQQWSIEENENDGTILDIYIPNKKIEYLFQICILS